MFLNKLNTMKKIKQKKIRYPINLIQLIGQKHLKGQLGKEIIIFVSYVADMVMSCTTLITIKRTVILII